MADPRPAIDGGRLFKLQWRLNEDGGGTVWWMVDFRSHVKDHQLRFDSLDELPEFFADTIREDGRTEGDVRYGGGR